MIKFNRLNGMRRNIIKDTECQGLGEPINYSEEDKQLYTYAQYATIVKMQHLRHRL